MRADLGNARNLAHDEDEVNQINYVPLIRPDDNIAAIDACADINFITCYSPHYAPELIHVKISGFTAVNTVKNQGLTRAGKERDLLMAWRTTGEYLGKELTVVVTYNPMTGRKQRYNFESKLLRLEEFLYSVRMKVRKQEPQWKNEKRWENVIWNTCEERHFSKDLYDLDLEEQAGRLAIRFRKSALNLLSMFGAQGTSGSFRPVFSDQQIHKAHRIIPRRVFKISLISVTRPCSCRYFR